MDLGLSVLVPDRLKTSEPTYKEEFQQVGQMEATWHHQSKPTPRRECQPPRRIRVPNTKVARGQ
jgi:hypothetical protein